VNELADQHDLPRSASAAFRVGHGITVSAETVSFGGTGITADKSVATSSASGRPRASD
jgi:hypothetical protein